MDTTEKNIKMLEKAPEIQALAPETKQHLPEFEKALSKYKHEPIKIVTVHGDFYYKRDDGYIWLPRQDELQEMLEKVTNWFLLDDLNDFMDGCLLDWERAPKDGLHTPPPKLEWQNPSMEQLWLAFVMKEKYTKQWDDQKEDWVELPNEG